MTENNKYKNLSIVLGILMVVFAVMYFTKGEDVSDTLESATEKLMDCKNDIAEWQNKYRGSTTTEEARDDLDKVLENCNEDVKGVDEQI